MPILFRGTCKRREISQESIIAVQVRNTAGKEMNENKENKEINYIFGGSINRIW